MDISNLDFGALMSVYIGLGLIATGLPGARNDNVDYYPQVDLKVPGSCLLIIGALVLLVDLLHHSF
jgi:hypothetical protein